MLLHAKVTKVAAALLFFIFMWPVRAQVGAPGVIHQTLIEPGLTATGDLDGDGYPDIVAACRMTFSFHAEVVWTKNLQGTGNGPLHVISALAGSISMLDLGDLDGDGDLDVVCGSAFGSIYWFQNDGIGGFGPRLFILPQGENGRTKFAITDVDGDGDPDIAYAQADEGISGWCVNNGAGAFSAPTILDPDTPGAFHVSAGDLDGDGDPDLLVSGYHLLQWYENTNGAFSIVHVVYSGMTNHPITTIADLDSDGDMDIAAGTIDSFYKQLRIYLNSGSGEFGSEVVVDEGILISDYTGVVNAVDMDGDQDLDLFIHAVEGIDEDPIVRWYANNGNGAFTEAVTISAFPSVDGRTSDLDLDGDRDVVVTFSDVKVETWSNNGAGELTRDRIVLVRYGGPWSLAAGDIDGDGDQDVLIGQTNSHSLLWAENCGGLAFDTVHYLYSGWNGPGLFSLLEDMDGDGRRDAVFRVYDTGLLHWARNLGGGAFAPLEVISGAPGSGELEVADLDNDGDKDILLNSGNPTQRVRWIRNDGGGEFSTPPQQWISGYMTGLTWPRAADVDGDGDIDVYASDTDGDVITWYENSNGFSVGVPVTHEISAEVAKIGTEVMADLDMDGNIDLTYARLSDDAVVWRRNEGSGVFAPEASLLTPDTTVRMMTTVDMNMDGRSDLVIQHPGVIVWARNMGNGVFAPPVELLEGYLSKNMALADLDGDGDQDPIYHELVQPWRLLYAPSELDASNSWEGHISSGAGGLYCAPVPFTTSTMLHSHKPFEPGSSLEIRDALGRSMRKFRIIGTGAITLNRDNLAAGVYTITVTGSGSALRTIKVLVE